MAYLSTHDTQCNVLLLKELIRAIRLIVAPDCLSALAACCLPAVNSRKGPDFQSSAAILLDNKRDTYSKMDQPQTLEA